MPQAQINIDGRPLGRGSDVNRRQEGASKGMRYLKMSGCGNDFVIIDARGRSEFALSSDQVRAISDRHAGLGCDQLILVENSERAAAAISTWNSDGSQTSACGNGSRCVAWVLLEESQSDFVEMETRSGMISARRLPDGRVSVDMGPPRLEWSDIPVSAPTDTVRMDYLFREDGGRVYAHPGGVNMGNPHAVFFVADVDDVSVESVGSGIELDPFFPERVNVGFAQVIGRDRIRLRVWERGAGLTKACGTGACAAAVAAHRAGLTGRNVTIIADGGELTIDWREDGHVILTGPVEIERVGEMAA
jgi:diaminopimelate epimerase